MASDGAQKLSKFFRMNGKPLTPVAGEAVEAILGCKAYELYKKEFAAFDDDNEDVSVLPVEIKEQDEAFALLMDKIKIDILAADYIKQNAGQFIKKHTPE